MKVFYYSKHKILSKIAASSKQRTFNNIFSDKSIRSLGKFNFSAIESSELPKKMSIIKKSIIEASDILPHQAILENFVHHNPLENLEHMHWNDALLYVINKESYSTPGEKALLQYKIDPRKRAHEAFSDLASSFLDRGAAKWAPSFRHKGFLYFFSYLENTGFSKWRKYARKEGKRLLPIIEKNPDNSVLIAEEVIQDNLDYFEIVEEEYTDCIRAILLEIRGWTGMFCRLEHHPNEAPNNTKVSLIECTAVLTILLRSAIESLSESNSKEERFRLKNIIFKKKEEIKIKLEHPSSISYLDQNYSNQEKREEDYEEFLINNLNNIDNKNEIIPDSNTNTDKELIENNDKRTDLQVYACIDDRMCSLRRWIEHNSTSDYKIETYGIAGFFGIPIKYNPVDGRDEMILAPEGQNPDAVVFEKAVVCGNIERKKKLLGKFEYLWENASFSPIGSLILSLFFPFTYARLLLLGHFPYTKYQISKYLQELYIPKFKTDFKSPFTPEQSAAMLSRTILNIGQQKSFGKIILVLGHGAISINNPYIAAYNCGACGGREGGPNARILSRLANDPEVRRILREKYSIDIPDDTVFIGGMHNTTSDIVEFYDIENLNAEQKENFEKAKKIISRSLGRNAQERCQKFFLANNISTPEQALRHVTYRSYDSGEVRPELNHATNSGVVVGRRELTKGKSLDRRVFLPSYDPFNDDDKGTNLEYVLTPAMVVASGINLEYLLSTINSKIYGAGTKVPLNIVGNIGVSQGTAGDLRIGLPSQMTEMHIPIRSLFIIDAPVNRVEAVLNRNTKLYNLVKNEWVKMCIRDPYTGKIYKNKDGKFVLRELLVSSDSNDVNIRNTFKNREDELFKSHKTHGISITRKETIVYYFANLAILMSFSVPCYLFFGGALNPRAFWIALGGTAISLPILSFSRRYLHGEYMFSRIAFLSTGLVLGFNTVAFAPDFHTIMLGWGIFGFASTFLIGLYNERITVRNNAMYAFGVYRISDFAMILAAAYMHTMVGFAGGFNTEYPVVAASILIAALFKSSQFPLTSLFVRSMEGPTPCSALGYAGLSAHVGVVLLTSTFNLWFGFDWARVLLGSVGLITAVESTLKSKIRSERKGGLANATSGTIGVIFFILSLGYSDLALLLSFGHASFRIIQVLRVPNKITDCQKIKAYLGKAPWPKVVPDSLYKICWTLKRIGSDMNLFDLVIKGSKIVKKFSNLSFTKKQQWAITTIAVILAGFPSPLSYAVENYLIDNLTVNPLLCAGIIGTQFVLSVILIRFLFMVVLHPSRFTTSLKELFLKKLKK